jgi:hypothetical protein
MPRALIWLENSTFAAWGCEACGWIMRGLRPTAANAPPLNVNEAFNKHDCAKYPRTSSR